MPHSIEAGTQNGFWPRFIRQAWIMALLLLLLSLCGLGFLFASPRITHAFQATGLPPVIATGRADYRAEQFATPMQPLSDRIVESILQDAGVSGDELVVRMGTLTARLVTPIPTATLDPRYTTGPSEYPNATSLPPTATKTPKIEPTRTTVPATSQTQTPIPTATITYSWPPNNYVTLTATENPTAAPTRKPKRTSTPTATSTGTGTAPQNSTTTPMPTITETLPPIIFETDTPTPLPTLAQCSNVTTDGITAVVLEDTYIANDGSNAGANFGGEQLIRIRPDNGGDRRGLLKFPMPGLPANATVSQAILYFYEINPRLNEAIEVHQVTSDWTEMSVTWNSNISFNPMALWTLPADTAMNCMRAVYLPPALVDGWIKGTIPNQGLLLLATGNNGEIQVISRENIANPNFAARLNIQYRAIGPSP